MSIDSAAALKRKSFTGVGITTLISQDHGGWPHWRAYLVEMTWTFLPPLVTAVFLFFPLDLRGAVV
jgi:hypothetical protein